MKRHIFTLALLASAYSVSAQAEPAVCYNCPPQWADWATMLKAIDKNLDIQIPLDNKNSGQALSQILAERGSPVADVVYYGITGGTTAKREGVVEPYTPAKIEEVPEGLKDPEGNWFAVHYGTIGFFVNVDALGGAPVPKCYADLLKPEYKGMVGYLDPSSAFAGYASAVAVNQGLGGDLKNFDPVINYFRELQANRPIVPKQTAYARVVSGEMAILFDYDFNAYRAKYEEDGNYEFVVPCEGTISVPYVMSLVKNAPHPDAAKKVLDYVLSDEGQQIWANAYLKPSRPVELPADVSARFLPDSEYERAVSVNYDDLEAAQAPLGERYLNEVR